MVVYKEISSLVKDLGFSKKALYYASNSIDKLYHNVSIPKQNGELRQLQVPNDFLKAIQKSIAKNLLAYEPISPYATAYRYGGSTIVNARPHINKSVVLKLDIRHFFDNITYPMVKEKVFAAEKYSEENRILLSILCVYQHSVPQGAPTSPFISNIIMRDFDNTVGEWCEKHNVTYTRYCDDMTFSGDFESKDIIDFIEIELLKYGFFLNKKKTTLLHNGQRKVVTGIVVNEKATVPISYRKKLRQEMYYIKKYGVESHIKKCGISEPKDQYLKKLLGRINYALSVHKDEELLEYRQWLNEEKG